MKKQLLFILFMLFPIMASADAVEIDGIYYNLITKGNVAEVTSHPSSGYSGNITIPSSVVYEDVTYNVTAIGLGAFYYCSNLTSISIPNSVTSIGSDAFFYCSSLTSINIPNSVTRIGESAFGHCSMTSVTIPNSVTSIASYTFTHCSNLTSVTIPNSVTSIDLKAFFYCSSLTSINIPNSVTSIGLETFAYCSSLTSINIPNSVTSIGSGAFYNCTSLTSINIPNSVTSIGDYAFRDCSSLTSINIPNSVTKIGNNAFYSCSSLTSINIGSSIKDIYANAFASCAKLQDVYCYSENVPSTQADSFKDSYIDYATLHVPAASINLYKTAEPWKNFKSIVAIDGGSEMTKCAAPTISYKYGKLSLACETEGAEYVTDITDTDIKKHYDATISLTATYNISVYATKSGYENSDIATATLCWIDQQPTTEGITDGVGQIASRAVLVKTDNGFVTVEGVENDTNVSVYTVDGKQVGSTISHNNSAIIATNIQKESIVIVKIGNESVKLIMK